MTQKILKSEYPYRGHILNLRIDQVQIDDDTARHYVREVVEHRGAVAIVAVDVRERVLLVRQFRSGPQADTLELPAGTLEPGEDPAQCAARELKEETGYVAARWRSLGSFYTSPGYCTEKIYLFLAKKLIGLRATPEEDESIQAEWVSRAQARGKIKRGEIMDAKTIIGLQYLAATQRRSR
ncbi:MAG: NUDIX hydrolase [Chloroflexi bacterium]|nr:NUDIX hydrolase [Chloroflexota bacterium]